MGTIIINGWETGLKKVSLTKLQIELLGMSLSDSKKNVDKLLDDKEIIISGIDPLIAISFVDKAKKLGVICSFKP